MSQSWKKWRLPLAACLVLAAGCGTEAPSKASTGGQPAFGSLQLEVVPAPGDAPVICPAEAGLVLGLAGLQPGGDRERSSLRVAVGCSTEGESGEVLVHTAMQLTVAVDDEPDALHEGFSVGLCPWCWRGQGFLSCMAVGRAIRDAVTRALEPYEVTVAPDSEVIAILSPGGSATPNTLLAAVGQAGDRQLTGSVEPLMRLLDGTDRNVVLRAIGALGRIGDPQAVRALGRLALSPAPEVPFAAMQAIADIGGDRAIRTLELVSDQTTDTVVAREALDHLAGLKGEREQ